MTTPAFPARRRPSARTGWWLVVAGWLIQVPAAAGAIFISDVLAALSLMGAACVAVGAYLLRGKGAVWLFLLALLGGVVMFAGLAIGSAALADGIWGKAAPCQVAGVQRSTYDATHTTSDDRGGTSTTTETRVTFLHSMSCPAGTYKVSADSPRPVGSTAEVIYAPRSSRAPMFAEQNRGDMAFAGAALALGGLIELLLPFIAWRRGRRLPIASPPLPPPPPPTPYAPNAPYPPYAPPRPGEPVPLESPRFEQAVRDSMGRSMSPGERVALPFVVRLLRRRMEAKEAPPPQGPPVHRPPPNAPPPNAPPYRSGGRPYEQWPDNRPPGQRR